MKPIDYRAAHTACRDLERAGGQLAETASDIATASGLAVSMMEACHDRDEYIDHLERRLAELRTPSVTNPPTSVLATLALLEDAGAQILQVRCATGGSGVFAVTVLWPGHDTPHEHRMPDEGGQAAFSASLREFAASLSQPKPADL